MLTLLTLGGLAMDGASAPIEVSRIRKPLALLALVGLGGGASANGNRSLGVGRERVQTLLWPESEAERARGALKQALYLLRQTLGVDPFVTRGATLAIDPDVLVVDATRFEEALRDDRLDEAVTWYRGPFLDGVYLRDAPEFERWADEQRAHLAAGYGRALERLAAAATARGDANAAVEWARRRASADPLSSRAARTLMEALVAAGDREAAIRYAGVHAALVRAELGAELDPSVAALARRLRSHAPPPDAPPAAVAPQQATAPPPATSEAPPPARGDAVAPARGPSPHARRRSFVAGAFALAAVALVGIAVARRRPPHALRVGTLTQVTLGQHDEADPAISPDGQFVAYAATLPDDRRAGRALRRILVQRVSGGRAIALTSDPPTDQSAPAWAPDGSRIAYLSPDGIFVVSALGGTPQLIVAANGRSLALGEWSHDGRRLAYTDRRSVWIRELDTGVDRPIPGTGAFGAKGPTWSPDDSAIAFVAGTGGVINIAPSAVWLVRLDGTRAVPMTDSVQLNFSPVFAADGRSVLFVSNRDGARDIYEQRLRDGIVPDGPPARLTIGANAARLSLAADGRHLVYGVAVMRSNVWSAPIRPDAATPISAAVPLTSGDQEVECVSVSRDGRWLIFDSNRAGSQDIYKVPTAGGDPIRLTTDRADDFCGTMSPDGEEIAFYSFRGTGNRRLYTMRADGSAQAPVSALDTVGQAWGPDWSADASRIVYTFARTGPRRIAVRARDAARRWGRPREFPTPAATVVRWSPDGRVLAAVTDSGVAILSPDGGIVRFVGPRATDSTAVTFVAWGRDPSVVYYRTDDADGRGAFWSVPSRGGTPRLLLRLGDAAHRSRRVEFTTDGDRLYFTLTDDRASVWQLELAR